jgi:hypothetical protein
VNPFDDIVAWLMKPITAAAGWAWDTVTGGVTNWLAKGFVQLTTYVWLVMDKTSQPHLDAEWFTGGAGSPYRTAVQVAVGLLMIVLLCAIIDGVIQGRPTEVMKRFAAGTPTAIAGMLFTAAFAQVAVELCDAISNGIWSATRSNAVHAVDGLLRVSMTLPGSSFLGPLVLAFGMIGMLLLWVTLLVRESLVYLVVALCPMAFAVSVWPVLAGVRKRALELLFGLIFSKVAIALALAVGLGAMGGVGATGQPGADPLANGAAEFGTLISGVVVFTLAAFMPFLVIKLVPIVEAAVVAQGISSAPVRMGQQGLQYSYYVQGARDRMSRNRASAALAGPSDSSEGGASGMGASSMTRLAGSAAAGPAAPAVAAAGVAVAAVRRVGDTASDAAGDSS